MSELRKGSTLDENMSRVIDLIETMASFHGQEAVNQYTELYTKTAFQKDMDVIAAQRIVAANEPGRKDYILLNDTMLENGVGITRASESVRFKKATRTFQANMKAIHKSIITKDGLCRGFSTNSDDNVISVNFKPSRYNMAS